MTRRHRFRALRQEIHRRSRRRMLGWVVLVLLLGTSAVLLVHGGR